MASYHVGDIWEPEATVTLPGSETPVEPATWTFTFEASNGRKTTGTVTKVSTGKAKSAQELTEPGVWTVSVQTTTPKASQPSAIPVHAQFDST